MRITIESTCVRTKLDGVPVRLWEGVTEGGARCRVFVHRIAVADDQPAAEFEAELQKKLPPAAYFDLRMIL